MALRSSRSRSGSQDRPVIGLTLDWEPAGGYSSFPWYALRENYCGTVAAHGGLPLPLPHEPELAGAYLDRIDALIVTGGQFDIDPALFGATERHETVTTKQRRTAFEQAILGGALERDMPVLGICGGQQLLHVLHGGRLIQHIPDAIPDALDHRQPESRDRPAHPVAIAAGTRLRALAGGAAEIAVNSNHHQAAADCPPGVVVSARAPDGVIEAIEVPGRRFCLGLQWHPEFQLGPCDQAVFAALIAAASDA